MPTEDQREAIQALREKRALMPDRLPADPGLARQLYHEALAAIDQHLSVVACEYPEQPPPDAGDSDDPPPLSRDLSGDLDAIPSHRITEEGGSGQ